jgi:glycosyltransferase involved in cell wall biosynthesis
VQPDRRQRVMSAHFGAARPARLGLEEQDVPSGQSQEAAGSPVFVAGEGGRPSICFVGLRNLAVLAPQFDSGGAAGEPVQQTLLATALARRGYSVSMVTTDFGQADGQAWEGVTTYKAFAPGAGIPILRFIHPRWTGLWAALRRADADVYYVSCAGAIVGQVALFCRMHRKRFVFRVASDADCVPDTLIIEYARDKWLYEYGLRRASGVLAQTVKQQQLLRDNYGVDSEVAKLVVARDRSDSTFHERNIDALWVSNIRRLKRPDLLLRLAGKVPDASFHIVGGIGAGERDCFEETRTQAQQLENVTFHGPLSFRDATALFGRVRVFVNTSDVEGFPNTYLQAWAAGTPVVAFFDPDGLIAREGLGIAVKTLDEMQAAVSKLLRSEAEWNAASARCKAFFEREYAEDLVLKPYISAIQDAQLARAPRARRTGHRGSVVMVGPALGVRGGVSAVERALIESAPESVPIRHVATMVEGPKWLKLVQFVRALFSITLRLRRHDLVHIHFASGASSRRKMLIARFALARGARVILHAHGGAYQQFWASISQFERVFTLKTLCRAHRLVVLGERWREFFASLGVPRENIVTLPNPVSLPKRLPDRTAHRSIRFVYLGMIDRRKGAFDLLEALARLSPAVRERVHLVIAGNGAVDELRLLAIRLGIAENVDVRDWIHAQERDRLLASSDAFVLPSYAEGLPMSLLEAMAWGLAPICTPVGSVPEYIKDGINGLLIEPGKIDELAAAIEKIALDPALRVHLGRVARSTVEPLDAEVYTKKVCALYRAIGGTALGGYP